jgi:hypothetical protein
MTLGRHHGGRFDEFVEAGGDAASHRIRDLPAIRRPRSRVS